jgi:alpha-tubulin suppressor-like RCC1 family protein
LKTDSTVWCWGDNQWGALGDGSAGPQKPNPVQVAGLTGVAQIVTNARHACARKTDGTAWCWGYNHAGQLGDGTTLDRSTPAQVTALGTSVRALGAGVADYTCAVKTDGTLWCWGNNLEGELGDGTMLSRSTPVQVAALGNRVAEVATAGVTDGGVGGLGGHTCARLTDAAVWCWGDDVHGVLGNGVEVAPLPWPRPVTVFTGTAVALALGDFDSCVLGADGRIACWGFDASGQLGDGGSTTQLKPVAPLLACP